MWLCLSFVPRLSVRANEKSKVMESWVGPGNKASFVYSAQQDECTLPCLQEISKYSRLHIPDMQW